MTQNGHAEKQYSDCILSRIIARQYRLATALYVKILEFIILHLAYCPHRILKFSGISSAEKAEYGRRLPKLYKVYVRNGLPTYIFEYHGPLLCNTSLLICMLTVCLSHPISDSNIHFQFSDPLSIIISVFQCDISASQDWS